MAHELAIRFALIACATSLVQGLIQRASFTDCLEFSLTVMLLFYVFGLACGEAARLAVAESVAAEITRREAEQQADAAASGNTTN